MWADRDGDSKWEIINMSRVNWKSIPVFADCRTRAWRRWNWTSEWQARRLEARLKNHPPRTRPQLWSTTRRHRKVVVKVKVFQELASYCRPELSQRRQSRDLQVLRWSPSRKTSWHVATDLRCCRMIPSIPRQAIRNRLVSGIKMTSDILYERRCLQTVIKKDSWGQGIYSW